MAAITAPRVSSYFRRCCERAGDRNPTDFGDSGYLRNAELSILRDSARLQALGFIREIGVFCAEPPTRNPTPLGAGEIEHPPVTRIGPSLASVGAAQPLSMVTRHAQP